MKTRRLMLLIPVIVLFIFALYQIHSKIRPITRDIAIAKISDMASDVLGSSIHREITRNQIGYDDLITLERNTRGDVVALRTDMQKINLLKAHIMADMEADMLRLDQVELGVPMGNLFGVEILSGRGPKLPVRIIAVASSGADFFSEFEDAGINQTIHRIMMRVSLDLVVLLPGGTIRDTVYTDVCVTETVLLGQVPEWYQYYEKDG